MNINKIIYKTIGEIVCLTIVIVASLFIRLSSNAAEFSKSAYAYSNRKYTLDVDINNNFGIIKNINNEESYTSIIVNNNTKESSAYKLYFAYDNTNPINKLNLKISINGVTYFLKNLKCHTTGYVSFYEIDAYKISSSDSKEYNINLWLDDDTVVDRELNMGFQLEEI